MPELQRVPPVDYLVIGHVSQDRTIEGPRLGGTAAYAGLTAHVLGLRVGAVISAGSDLDLSPLADLHLICTPARASTTFENRYTPQGRTQILLARAERLEARGVPDAWKTARILHLGPIADEVDPDLVGFCPAALVGLTPQGWMRAWDARGTVERKPWPRQEALLHSAGAVVLSLEDVGGDEHWIEEMAGQCRVLAVTDSANGARVYWNRDLRRIPAPPVEEVDPTGSGDIFAAAFFIRLLQTRDPWEAGRFATALASASVARRGLAAVPTAEEVTRAGVQVLP